MRTKNNSLFDKITEYVDAYFDNNGRSPTTREIENAVKFSRQTVHRYLKVMSEQGEIEYDGHRSIIWAKNEPCICYKFYLTLKKLKI